MAPARVSGVRSVELGVRDINASLKFYSEVWGLEVASTEGSAYHLRGTGTEHHVLTLREQGRASLLGVHFSAPDSAAVDELHGKAKGYGVDVGSAPAPLSAVAGGGYGFRFTTPDGLPMSISAGVKGHTDAVVDRSRPTKISHVVLNSSDAGTDQQVRFFIDALGFRLSDTTQMMEFLRCSSDHHSIAMFRGKGPSLNHVAYEVPNIDGLMRGTGRVKRAGIDIEWGIGRHGPGANVFSYFIEPDGFVTEYTTELEQIDEATHVPMDAAYWHKMMPFPGDRWGTAGAPSNRVRAAMSGEFYAAERCEEVMARKRA